MGIEEIEWIRDLPTPIRDALARKAIERRYPKGARIFRAADVPRGLFVILDGRVRVVREDGRRRHLVHEETVGGTLGEVPLFAGGRYPATALAASAVVVALIQREALDGAMRAGPELGWRLLERLAGRVRILVDRLDQRAQGSVRAMVASRLLDRSRAAAGPVTLGATHLELAEEWGTVRDVVAREIGVLVRRGLVAGLGRGRYRIVRPDQLEAVRELGIGNWEMGNDGPNDRSGR
jgi:CRP/FNR family transcriptional regulator